jgi:hypothetical protein
MRFTPSAIGQRSGTLTITHNAGNVAGSTSTVALVGNGVLPDITLSPRTLSFGSASVGSAGPVQSITLTSSGSMTVGVFGLTLSGPNADDFQIVGEQRCMPAPARLVPPAGLEVGTICAVQVGFMPRRSGALTARLDVLDDTPQQMHSVSLSGTGVATSPDGVLDPAQVDLGVVGIGRSVPAEFSLSSTGGVALSVKSVSVTEAQPGRNGPEFSIVKDRCTGSVLDPSTRCVLVVVFTPTDVGYKEATLVVVDDAAGGQQTAILTAYAEAR